MHCNRKIIVFADCQTLIASDILTGLSCWASTSLLTRFRELNDSAALQNGVDNTNIEARKLLALSCMCIIEMW